MSDKQILVVGPTTNESECLVSWGSVRGVRIVHVPLDPPADVDLAQATAALVDGSEEPSLAIAETARLRRKAAELPILFLGPGGGNLERAALRAGCSHFLERPIGPERLRSYVDHLASRPKPPARPRPIELGRGVSLDRDRHCLWIDRREQPLSPDKFRLLQYFVDNPGRAIAASELVQRGILSAGQSGRYRATILELRARLGRARDLLKAVPGFGYRFEPEDLGFSS